MFLRIEAVERCCGQERLQAIPALGPVHAEGNVREVRERRILLGG